MITNSIEQLKIPNFRRVNDTVFSGATLEGKLDMLSKIKNAGISTVVDFREGVSPALQSQCKTVGLSYLQFPLDHTLSLGIKPKTFVPKTVANEFVAQMRNFFGIMNEGNAYIGCNYGIDRTNAGLCYNFFLNQSAKKQTPPIILTWADSPDLKGTINRLVRCVYKTAKGLSEDQKNLLGITVNNKDLFKALFKTKIGEMISRNLRYIK